jgi:transposase
MKHRLIIDECLLINASFNQSPSTQKLVADAGRELLFLPTDSPDLNPIEHLYLFDSDF